MPPDPPVSSEVVDELALRQSQAWHALGDDYPLLRQAKVLHRNDRQQPMSYRGNPSLIEMYIDFPHLDGADISKAVQTGVSELIILFHLYAAGWKGKIAAMVLPQGPLRDRFVQRRVDTVTSGVEEYRNKVGGYRIPVSGAKAKKGAENLKLKSFGDGTLMFLGAASDGDFVEFSCDILTIDEFDQCELYPLNLAKAWDRLRNSPYPQFFRVGNPSIPRWGIDKIYNEGDGRLFHWRCERCGERQPLDWYVNIVRRRDDGVWEPRDRIRAQEIMKGSKADLRPVCRKCGRPFERHARGAAWVAARPGLRRSYRMSRLDVMTDSIWNLFIEFLKAQGSREKLAIFHNSVLGLGYEDAASKLTVEMLEACYTGEDLDFDGGDKYAQEQVVMGVDVGTVLNVFIDVLHRDEKGKTYRRSVLINACSSFESLKDFIKRYHVQVCVIDAGPETRKASELRDWAIEEYGECQVYLCRFHPTDKVASEEFGMVVNYETSAITVDRTQLLDATFDEIREGERVFPKDAGIVDGFSDQMRAPVRKLDPKGRRFIWDEGNEPDHYRLADGYARVAADLAEGGGGFIG